MKTEIEQGRNARVAGLGSDGMTLVELMIALVVLSIGIMGVALMFPYGNEASTDDRNLTAAVDLAQQKMEQLRTVRHIDPDLDTGWHPTVNGEQVGTNNNFTRRWLVTQMAGTFSDVKQVEVQVTWTSANPDTVRLVSYFQR
jgi:type IV pilus assembly protein PilV